jgi:two-component system, chemotaxis family, response regulator Rcp1
MTMTMEGKPIQILMVEDNEGDVFLTTEAFKAAKVVNNLHVVRDGVEAMDFLHRRDKYAGAPRPDLLLLDLNLPRRDGREVLKDMKADPELKTIPVVVLTSSRAEEDVARAYDLQANCYIVKPVDFQNLMRIVGAIESFWLTVVRLPTCR